VTAVIDPARCHAPTGDRRRLFWATQPVCGATVDDCGITCAVPGLQLITQPCPLDPPDCYETTRTISSHGYIAGLALNILLTDGPRETTNRCGFRPGQRGGWWAQAYVGTGYKIGSKLRQMTFKGPISAAVGLSAAYAEADLQKLVAMGVVSRVAVEGRYLGNNRIGLDMHLFGEVDDPTRLGITGARDTAGWIWTSEAA
jgi:phage gp46-like protein